MRRLKPSAPKEPANVASATLDLVIRLKDEASSALDKVSGAMGGLATVAGGAALAGVVGLGAAMVNGANDAREAAKITAQTNAVITSTGAAAGVTAEQVEGYAAALSAASGASLFGDSQVQESTNLLLTFTNVKGAVLEAATAMSVDMAQALGGAPKDAAIQLGKALNDPIAGVNALSRVGVTFTAEQKETIATMVAVNDVAGAQAVILAELSKEFGGSAAAAAAADGGIAQFQDRLGEAAETAGAAFLPLLNSIGTMLNTVVAPAIEAAAVGFATFLAANQPAIEAFAATLVDQLGAAATAIVEAWQGLQPQIQSAIALFLSLLPAVQPLIDLIGANLQPILFAVAGLLGGALVVAIGSAVAAFLTAAAPILALVAVAELLFAAWQTNFGGIRDLVTSVMSNIQATIATAGSAIAAVWQSNGAAIMATAMTIFGGIQTYIGGVLNVLAGLFNTVLAVIRGDWQGAWQGLQQAGQGFMTAIGVVFGALQTVLGGAFNLAIGAIKSAWEAFVSGAGALGRAVIDGIVQGVQSGVGALASAVTGAAQRALDAAKAALGIRSPSQVMRDQVGKPIAQGMAEGVLAGIGYVQSSMKKLSDATVKELTSLAEKAQAAINGAIRDSVSSAAGYARARAGSERALFGLLPDPKEAQAAADKLTDIDAEMARLRVTAAQNDDPGKRADAAAKLIELEQERVTVAQKLARITAQNAQLATIQAAAAAAERQAIGESGTYSIDLQDDYYKMRTSQILEIAKLQQEMATATTEAERAELTEQLRIIEKAHERERELFALTAQDKTQTTAAMVDQLRELLAKLKITLPSGTIPGFASGTSYAPGGMALVGERGPELVNLPRGSRVHTANQTRGMMGANQTISIVINAAPGMSEKAIADAVGRELGRRSENRRRAR